MIDSADFVSGELVSVSRASAIELDVVWSLSFAENASVSSWRERARHATAAEDAGKRSLVLGGRPNELAMKSADHL
jgi:hypothetical protein